MNDLSWMLYIVGIIPNIGDLLVILAIFSIAGGVLAIIGATVATTEARRNRKQYGENDGDYLNMSEWALTWKSVYRWTIPLGITCAVLAAFMPSTTTLHLILASELGETAVTNPEVIEIFELLKENLKSYISK